MRYRRSILIAALASVLLASPLFAQTPGGGKCLYAMVLVPAGWFIMGSDEGDNDEKPRRRVYLDAFYIDKYPVTNARFRRLRRSRYSDHPDFNGENQPVVGVNWTQARDYCRSVGKRLPTEAEWEKAARGVDGRKYPWGNDWADGSNVIWTKNSGQKTHPVDRTYNTHRSPFGAVDMAGNVWEWVQDRYGKGYYRDAPTRNPKGPAPGSGVVRGGSWYIGNPSGFRAAYRFKFQPGSRGYDLGFRCAKAP